VASPIFLNMNGEAAIRSSIGTLEVFKRDVKYTRIILKLAKFYAHVDSYRLMPLKEPLL